VTVVDLAVRHPTLDDVFLSTTGRSAEPATAAVEVAGAAKGDAR